MMDPSHMPKQRRARRLTFAGILVTTLIAAVGYVLWAALRSDSSGEEQSSSTVSALRQEPHVVFQDVRGPRDDDDYSRVALTPLEGDRNRIRTRLVCDRVYFAAK